METNGISADQRILDDYQKNYVEGVTILKQNDHLSVRSKKVNVYVDGLLTTMSEDLLNHLIDIGFYIVVGRA